MLTARGWWFLLGVLLVLVVGLVRPSPPLALAGLALLLWFAAQWVFFLVRLPAVRDLRVEREVWDDRAAVETLWAGQVFEVRVRLVGDDWLPSPHLAAADHVPYGAEPAGGSPVAQGVLTADRPLEAAYRVRCGPAGLARFEGVRVRAADVQGFFHAVYFLRAAVVLPVLPVLMPRTGQPASTKRHNLLLPPGIHRHRRPGSGSELLDLRDYLPGDPPKTIAWKVSARRDRLITKVFESEVPVRCTLFVDASASVRVPAVSGAGPRGVRYGKALDRLVDLAAGVLHANAGIRDLTGLCLFDEEGASWLPPARGGRHRTECLRLLAGAASRPPGAGAADPEHLLPLAYSFTLEVYPELLRPEVNAVPQAMAWLEGFSAYPRRLRLGLSELLHRRKGGLRALCWWSSFWALVLPIALLAARVFLKARWLDNFLFLSLLLPIVSLMIWCASAFLLGVDALTGARKRRRDRWRKQLAAVLSARYGLAPGGLAALLEDDDALSRLTQRFLGEHQVPFALPLYGPEGRYQFAAPGKVSVLADALLRAVGRGRDNELFVLLADLLELDDSLEPLLAAVRVALGRHHQVMLICPWPPGLELPDRAGGIGPPPLTPNPSPPSGGRGGKESTLSPKGGRGQGEGGRRPPIRNPQAELWDRVTTARFHLGYQRLRRTFTRLGVTVLCAAGDEPVPLVLSRLERLRSGGRPHA